MAQAELKQLQKQLKNIQTEKQKIKSQISKLKQERVEIKKSRAHSKQLHKSAIKIQSAIRGWSCRHHLNTECNYNQLLKKKSLDSVQSLYLTTNQLFFKMLNKQNASNLIKKSLKHILLKKKFQSYLKPALQKYWKDSKLTSLILAVYKKFTAKTKVQEQKEKKSKFQMVQKLRAVQIITRKLKQFIQLQKQTQKFSCQSRLPKIKFTNKFPLPTFQKRRSTQVKTKPPRKRKIKRINTKQQRFTQRASPVPPLPQQQ